MHVTPNGYSDPNTCNCVVHWLQDNESLLGIFPMVSKPDLNGYSLLRLFSGKISI